MKKLFSLLLVAALLIGLLAACGEQKAAPTGGESGEGSGLIGVCMQNMSSSIAELESAALTETFEALGYEVQVVSADDSVSNQVQQIQNFILMDAEMLVVLPCEIETLEDTLLEAREAGIKVVISGGTGTISEDAYDAVSADDEYMIGMYVASVAKTWVEEHMDADGDWHVAFLSSTISDDAKSRCEGEAQILEPWLKNEAGEYVNLMGEVVSEAERIENPVYCEMIAERVTNLADCTTEMDISGDNRSVVAGVLTDDPNVRVIIAYNSLVSTAGSQYIMDTYPEDEQDEFAFFSGGVMGDEYEYLIGAVSETSGTKSVFRGACQFGGGDAALVCFDTSPYIESFTYEEVLARENLMVYWDEQNGYNDTIQEDQGSGEAPATAGGEFEGGTSYVAMMEGIGGQEAHQFDLMDDGTCQFFLPGNAMITAVYEGSYVREGDTLTITGLKNVDASSEYVYPGLWSFIDSATGDAVVTVDDASGTFTPAE